MTTETTDMLRPLLTDDEVEAINRTRALLLNAADRAAARVLAAAARAEDGEVGTDGLEQNRATIVEEYAKIASDALSTFLIRAKVYGGVPVTDEQLSHMRVRAKYGSGAEPDNEPDGDPDVEPDYGAGPEPDGMTEHDWRL